MADLLLAGRAAMARGHRRRRGISAAEPAQEEAAAVKERAAVCLVIAAGAISTAPAEPGRLVGNGHDLAVRNVDFPLDGGIGHFAVGALEDREQAPVAAVDIITNLKFAGVVDELQIRDDIYGRDRNKGRELDI